MNTICETQETVLKRIRKEACEIASTVKSKITKTMKAMISKIDQATQMQESEVPVYDSFFRAGCYGRLYI